MSIFYLVLKAELLEIKIQKKNGFHFPLDSKTKLKLESSLTWFSGKMQVPYKQVLTIEMFWCAFSMVSRNLFRLHAIA